ncbi:MAG: hypothetical protein IPL52_06055 [Flavobacteriales bacterium]|nr:hypothetical protein [Flavobacteriales bacterium]
MANKVYILIESPEDEPRIWAVFSTREAAEANLVLGDDESVVQEFELDPALPQPPPGHTLWYVFNDGGPEAFRTDAFEDYAPGEVILENSGPAVKVWARDKRHALELGWGLILRYQASLPS